MSMLKPLKEGGEAVQMCSTTLPKYTAAFFLFVWNKL